MDSTAEPPNADESVGTRGPSRKHPWLAALLALLLGPLGLLYLGWPTALVSALNVGLFLAGVNALHLIVLPWMPYAILVLLAFQGWATASWWNREAVRDDPGFAVRGSLTGALLLTRGQLPAMGHVYALGISFHLAFKHLAAGRLLKGMFALLVCPVLFTAFTFLFFRLISEGLATLAFRRLGLVPPAPSTTPGSSPS